MSICWFCVCWVLSVGVISIYSGVSLAKNGRISLYDLRAMYMEIFLLKSSIVPLIDPDSTQIEISKHITTYEA